MCVCVFSVCVPQAWADGPQRCYHTVSGHRDWCIATSKKVEHLAADPQSELVGPAFSLFSCCERADGWFGRNKHTLKNAALSHPQGSLGRAPETSPSSLQGGHDGGAGRDNECTEPWRRAETEHWNLLCYTWMEKIWPWVDSEGAFVSAATPYERHVTHPARYVSLPFNP